MDAIETKGYIETPVWKEIQAWYFGCNALGFKLFLTEDCFSRIYRAFVSYCSSS